jgi:hypothetical protein
MLESVLSDNLSTYKKASFNTAQKYSKKKRAEQPLAAQSLSNVWNM